MQNTKEFLNNLLGKDGDIELSGSCHDCKEPVSGLAIRDGSNITTTIPFWHIEDVGAFTKCDACYDNNPNLTNFQPTEVFSRVCGYVRPVKQYNPGKKAEKAMRVDYKIEG